MDDRDRHPHFFDSVGHGQMRAILDQRVRDGVIRRTTDTWLNAGTQHDGAIWYPDDGTPQGGVMTLPTRSQTWGADVGLIGIE